MPLSTSNSNGAYNRAPAKRWLLVWITTIVCAMTICGGAEAFWRSQDHQPSIRDTPEYWAWLRAGVSDYQPNHVVLLGASRMQLGFATEVFRQRFPGYQLTQLAVNGRAAMATLRDLANDSAFQGIVICSATSKHFSRTAWDAQQEYVDTYQNRTYLPLAIEANISWHAQSHLNILGNIRFGRVLK